MQSKTPKFDKVMIFGTFDLLHEGHLNFLRQARERGEELIVVVPSDRIARMLKNKKPEWNEKKRLQAVAAVEGVTKAVLGDDEIGTYSIIKKYQPDLVCFGYDQHDLRRDIEEKMRTGILPKISLKILEPHYPEKFKSSLLYADHL